MSWGLKNKVMMWTFYVCSSRDCMLKRMKFVIYESELCKYGHGQSHQNKQEANGPWFAHLSKTAIAYLQMPCNFLPVLPQQLGYKFDCAIKRSKFILGEYYLYKFGRPWVHDAIHQVSASKLSWFWRRRLLKFFFFFFFFFVFFIWVLQPFQEYFTYIEPIVHRRWAKTGEPREKPPDHP